VGSSSNYGSEEQTTQAVPEWVRGQARLQTHVCRLRALDVPSLPASAHMPSAPAAVTAEAARRRTTTGMTICGLAPTFKPHTDDVFACFCSEVVGLQLYGSSAWEFSACDPCMRQARGYARSAPRHMYGSLSLSVQLEAAQFMMLCPNCRQLAHITATWRHHQEYSLLPLVSVLPPLRNHEHNRAPLLNVHDCGRSI
jgi:hypothetical protein